MGLVVKWFIIYPGVALFGAGLAIMFAPFYGVVWVVRRSLRRRQMCRPVAQCFPVQRPVPRPYGFVPVQRERVTVEGRPFGSDRYV